jgi:hypothetical protein
MQEPLTDEEKRGAKAMVESGLNLWEASIILAVSRRLYQEPILLAAEYTHCKREIATLLGIPG